MKCFDDSLLTVECVYNLIPLVWSIPEKSDKMFAGSTSKWLEIVEIQKEIVAGIL